MCSVTVGVLGDICRAIEEQILPYCDRIMLLLVQNLQSPEVHRNIKPQILSAFGDVALAIGDKFVVRGRGRRGARHPNVVMLGHCGAVQLARAVGICRQSACRASWHYHHCSSLACWLQA